MAKDPAALTDRITESRTLAEGKGFDFAEVTLRSPDGADRTRLYVRHKGAVVVLPLLEQPGRAPKIVLVENERFAVGHRLFELPAGGIEPGEGPADAAARELAEETGYRASSLYELGWFYTTPGITDEKMHAYVATGLSAGETSLDEGERLVTRVLPMADLEAMMKSGEVRDAKTLLVMLMARRDGLLT